MDCVFCESREVQDRIIFENDLVSAFPSNAPITKGHVLIVAKRHVARIEELSQKERDAVFNLAEKLKKAIKESLGAEGFNNAWNDGEIAGQSIPHFHLHIVPRISGDEGITEYEPRKFLYRPGSRARSAQEELKQIAARIRSAFY